MRGPSSVRISPNSTVYQYSRARYSSACSPSAFCPPCAVCLHVVGEHRVEQQRHVTEKVVEDVGLDDVVELVLLAQPDRDRKPALREMREEDGLGQQPGHRDDLPAGHAAEALVHFVETGDPGVVTQRIHDAQELDTGPARHETHLPRIQPAPAVLLLGGVARVVLADRVIRAHPA